jgi:hypothetical protein
MDAHIIATTNEILRGVVGSTAHGTAIDGQDDRDEMGIFIEPPENVCGLTPCEHYFYRDKPEGVRSGPGDLDLTLYSLRKFCRLAAGGNPSVAILLWLPAHIIKAPLGAGLIGMREAFVSKASGARFLGYLVAQKQKMKGERAHTVSRPELVAKYGYDTKFAMHALRLGYEGIGLLTHRRLTLPVAEPNLSTLRAVRSGRISEAGAPSRAPGTELSALAAQAARQDQASIVIIVVAPAGGLATLPAVRHDGRCGLGPGGRRRDRCGSGGFYCANAGSRRRLVRWCCRRRGLRCIVSAGGSCRLPTRRDDEGCAPRGRRIRRRSNEHAAAGDPQGNGCNAADHNAKHGAPPENWGPNNAILKVGRRPAVPQGTAIASNRNLRR